MTTAPDDAALAADLATFPPLDALSAEQLARAVDAASIETFAAGEVVLDAFAQTTSDLLAVLDGEVAIWNDPEKLLQGPTERGSRGRLFGFSAYLAGQPVGPRIVANTPTTLARIPAPLVEPAFASPAGARFLALDGTRAYRITASTPMYLRVDDLIESPPLLVDAATPAHEVARAMTGRSLSCAVISADDGTYGLLTDTLLRARLLAEGRSPDTPAHLLMVHPAPAVRPDESAAEALLAMLDGGHDHLIVTDPGGILRGVVGTSDFVVSPTTAGVSLHEQIRRAPTAEQLVDRARQAPEMLADLADRGMDAERVIAVYSTVVDAVVRRAIALVFAGRPDLDTDAFTWLSLGSNGRREAVPSSDIDAAVAFRNDIDDEAADVYREAFTDVEKLLVRSGISVDGHGAVPHRPPFSRTNAQWRAAARRWLTAPEEEKATIMASILVDGRPIWGDLALPEVTRVFGGFRRHPRTMELLLAESLSHRARGRSIRDALVGKGDTFDIKKRTLLPIVNIARWAALGVESTELRTTRRLAAAAGSEILRRHDSTRLIEIFESLERIRLRHQLGQIVRGETPTDVIDRRTLSPIERSVIGESVREITAVQRRMDRVSSYLPVESWATRPAER
ncbi:putative nucleotidyltransferase substrate binding domain-containing protein [Gordonia sp. (in: high G+C Gram-positive bacteria)]|uniref:putative nucleotidyltransferase substrate binding domain-containing protein n=1 Tax=Gordonia sp. (in: high G+C Gram-positive bacteria) TaxID=84139 RepID=UPI0026161004|nr:putative nucleotidyltransferase substrate binding domain-containing protein [Gordonia sp. (in: high G+C Gram-positive bacteria)]